MALHYEPDKMIRLIQLCCWKGRTDMTQNGLIALAMKVGPDQADEKNGRKDAINDRYIVDLLSDARKALKDGSTIVKRESLIGLLLAFAGFGDWDAWKAALRTPGYFLSSETGGADPSGEKPVAVIVPHVIEKQLNPTLAFVKRSAPIDAVTCQADALTEVAKYALTVLERAAVVICALPLSWKDQAVKMRNPAWGEFSGNGRMLPVWVDPDNEWSPFPPALPSVKQEQATAGIPGILTGLLFLENDAYEQAGAARPSGSEAQRGAQEHAPQFHNSSIGFYMQGGTVHHLSTGGTQTINNHFD